MNVEVQEKFAMVTEKNGRQGCGSVIGLANAALSQSRLSSMKALASWLHNFLHLCRSRGAELWANRSGDFACGVLLIQEKDKGTSTLRLLMRSFLVPPSWKGLKCHPRRPNHRKEAEVSESLSKLRGKRDNV